jgi:RimJ/RimL family protein N-acetyltransferase
MSVVLRPLTLADLPLLHRWMSEPHLRPHYMQSDISADEVARKFTPRIDPAHIIRCRIAMFDGCDYGYAQWYPTASYADSGAMIAGFRHGVSVDYFIGDAAFLGRHLAAPMLRALVAEVFATMPSTDRDVFISHDDRNVVAARATRAAGFSATRGFQRKDGVAFTVYQSRAGGP